MSSEGKYASDHDHRIIDAVSVAMDGRIGSFDDVERLRNSIEWSERIATDKSNFTVACEIAVAFIRYSQDLRERHTSPHTPPQH